jgi:hypothetical protein
MLSTAPRWWFKELWSPKGISPNRVEDDLINHLTRGWERYEITEEPYSVFGDRKDGAV